MALLRNIVYVARYKVKANNPAHDKVVLIGRIFAAKLYFCFLEGIALLNEFLETTCLRDSLVGALVKTLNLRGRHLGVPGRKPDGEDGRGSADLAVLKSRLHEKNAVLLGLLCGDNAHVFAFLVKHRYYIERLAHVVKV